MSITNTRGVTKIQMIFKFLMRLNRITICIGVMEFRSIINLFHFTYQYTVPCSKRKSKRINETQNEYREYILSSGNTLLNKRLRKINVIIPNNSPLYRYDSRFLIRVLINLPRILSLVFPI